MISAHQQRRCIALPLALFEVSVCLQKVPKVVAEEHVIWNSVCLAQSAPGANHRVDQRILKVDRMGQRSPRILGEHLPGQQRSRGYDALDQLRRLG